jgi:quercetin dioxygenase-like cupin family protein
MELKAKPVILGRLAVNIYDAPSVGDILPMHSHGENDVHITIIARGSFLVRNNDWEIVAKAGDVIDWQVGEEHELTSLEPNSRFVNIIK